VKGDLQFGQTVRTVAQERRQERQKVWWQVATCARMVGSHVSTQIVQVFSGVVRERVERLGGVNVGSCWVSGLWVGVGMGVGAVCGGFMAEIGVRECGAGKWWGRRS